MVSSALRRRLREEKKVILEKQTRDEGLQEKYGLHADVDLGDEDVERSKEMWEARREARGLPIASGETDDQDGSNVEGPSVGSSQLAPTPRSISSLRKGKGREGDGSPSLAQVLRKSTAKKYDPFADAADAFLSGPSASPSVSKARIKIKDPSLAKPSPQTARTPATKSAPATEGRNSPGGETGEHASPAALSSIPSMAGGMLSGYGSD